MLLTISTGQPSHLSKYETAEQKYFFSELSNLYDCVPDEVKLVFSQFVNVDINQFPYSKKQIECAGDYGRLQLFEKLHKNRQVIARLI